MRRDWAVEELANISMRVTEKNSQLIDTVFTVSAEHGLIEQEKFFNKRVASKNLIGYTIVRPGSLVYNKSYSANAPLGVITRNIHKYIGVVSPLYIVFKAKEEKVLPRFLELATNSAMFHDSLKQFVKEGGRAHGGISVSLGDFFGSKLLVPSLTEQKRIVDLVSSVDAYVDALQHQADTTRRARNAVLHDLLSAGGDEWAETTLGEIGLNGMFADGDWVESKDQDPAGEYRLLQLADVGDGVFLDKSNRWMNSEQFHRLRCTPLNPRDILIARMPDPIARACVVPFGLPTCATVVDVAILRCGGRFLPEFVVLVINDSAFRAEAQSLLTGTTRQRISRSNLAKIICKIPSLTEQKRIVEIVSTLDDVILCTERAVVDAKALRSGLLSDLLSGNHEIPASYDSLLGAA